MLKPAILKPAEANANIPTAADVCDTKAADQDNANVNGRNCRVLSALTERVIEHKKEPIAISLPDIIGQRIRYSHINNIAGVMTTCRKSEHGNIMDQSLKRNNVFRDGQQLFSAKMRIVVREILWQQKPLKSMV
ncbi:hypothetical protein U1Q18_029390 [Sarracenia purpurea var. burkii]